MTDRSLLRSGRFGRLTQRRGQRFRKVRIGKRELLTHGIAPSFWNDVFHSAMTANWPTFLGGLAVVFVVLNAGFAILYAVDPNGVANAKDSLLEMFFFSIETLTTVGYGEMFPQTDYAHVVVSIETFVGLFFTASMLGLIFARVSRPRARLIFAKAMTVGPHEGRRTLVLRVANARLNMIGSATARLWIAMQQNTQENVPYRRFLEMKLVRSENPVFTLSWTILHTIDETSPLFGLSQADLAEMDAFFILSIAGHDETSVQEVRARETYSVEDIRWDHKFVDILERTEAGMTLLNYERFHDVEPVNGGVEPEMAADRPAPAP